MTRRKQTGRGAVKGSPAIRSGAPGWACGGTDNQPRHTLLPAEPRENVLRGISFGYPWSSPQQQRTETADHAACHGRGPARGLIDLVREADPDQHRAVITPGDLAELEILGGDRVRR